MRFMLKHIISNNPLRNMSKNEGKKIHNKVRPLADRVLVKEIKDRDREKVTASGIIIPETVGEDKGAKKGDVVEGGPGKVGEDGKIIPLSVKAGDTVLFQWGDMIKIDGEEYYILREDSILAVIK